VVHGGLVLVIAVVDDLQDLDGTERGAEAAKGCELVGVDLWHAAMMLAAPELHHEGVGGVCERERERERERCWLADWDR
jgi:hypothetical protein